jgi:RHS repeat-associated protein
MQLASGSHIPDGPLAANALLSEKLHQGFAAPSSTLHQGFSVSISSTPLGIISPLYDDGTGSRSSGKERDAESGLDYFGARYYGSNMGRWMSPDPKGNSVADFANPQSWNMYAYVLNNPLKYVDPTGLDCAYLNDAGDGIESTDRNSSIGECNGSGGYWVSGQVNTLSVDDNGGYHFGYQGMAADGNYTTTTYLNYLGPNTDNSYSSAFNAAASLLTDFELGTGDTVRNYDLSTVEGRNFLLSKGVQQLNARIKAGCAAGQQSGPVALDSFQAARNIRYDLAHSPTGGQVGGYGGGTYQNNGDSTDITFQNVAGAHSLYYHEVPDRPSGSTGPNRSIIQNFTLSEPNPCTHP